MALPLLVLARGRHSGAGAESLDMFFLDSEDDDGRTGTVQR